MAQDTSGLRAILSHGWVYDLAQRLFGARRTWKWMQREFIRALPGQRVLDIGCGTGGILAALPELDYVGIDISRPYILRARARWGRRGHFHHQELNAATLAAHGTFDLILATGVLHHLDDDQAVTLFEMLAPVLNPWGRIVTVDGCHTEAQNPVARFLISKDRGRNVRTPQAYTALTRRSRLNVQGWVIHRKWIPYTYWIMRVSRSDA